MALVRQRFVELTNERYVKVCKDFARFLNKLKPTDTVLITSAKEHINVLGHVRPVKIKSDNVDFYLIKNDQILAYFTVWDLDLCNIVFEKESNRLKLVINKIERSTIFNENKKEPEDYPERLPSL